MKKITAIILAVMMTLAIVALPCAAYEPKTAKAVKATAIIDAEMEDIWKETDVLTANLVNKTIIYNADYASQATAKVRLLWDAKYLYVFAEILDPDLYTENKNGSASYVADGIEIQLDEKNDKSGKLNVQGSLNGKEFNGSAGSYQVFADSTTSGFGDHYEAGKGKFRSAVKVVSSGYHVEMAIPWNTLSPAVGTQIGLEIQINDNITGDTREGLVSWNSYACLGWQDTEAMGTSTFVDSPEGYVPPEITESEPVTDAPTESDTETQPTDTSDKSGTDEATDTKPQTGTDGKTDKPSDDNKDDGGINPMIWIGIAAVVIIAAVIAVILFRKKKK